jgi:hypothetical protein
MRRAASFCSLAWLACTHASAPEASLQPPAALPAKLPAPAAAPVAAGPIWSVSELRSRRGLALGTLVRLRARVVAAQPCPPCPAPAECKPCTEVIDVAERADSPLRESVAIELVQSTQGPPPPAVSVFRVGEPYVFSGTLSGWAEPSDLPFAYLEYASHVAAQ